MSKIPLVLDVLPDRLAVCRLAADAELPTWVQRGRGLVSVTRTPDELSIVCPMEQVPAGIRQEGPFRALKVRGPLDFALTGILSGIAQTLALAQISIFALSTFDTDYILVRSGDLEEAAIQLELAGHTVDK